MLRGYVVFLSQNLRGQAGAAAAFHAAMGGAAPGDPTARRPADVYIPRWRQGLPLAMDFAVTSGLNPDVMAGPEVACEIQVMLAECMKTAKRATKTQPPCATSRGSRLFPWWLKQIAEGGDSRHELSGPNLPIFQQPLWAS